MGLTVTWAVVRGVLTLGFAVAVVSKSSTTFESSAFLAALIAYHRIGFSLSSESMGALKRGIRTELWFHRLIRTMRGAGQQTPDLPPVLRDLELNQGYRSRPDLFDQDEELAELNAEVERIEKKSKIHGITQAVIEVLLILGLIVVLLS